MSDSLVSELLNHALSLDDAATRPLLRRVRDACVSAVRRESPIAWQHSLLTLHALQSFRAALATSSALTRLTVDVLADWQRTLSLDDAMHTATLRTLLQLLANASVSCEAAQNAVWSAWFPLRFTLLLESRDSATLDASLVCLLYATRLDNAKADALLSDPAARGLLRAIFDALTANRAFDSALLVVRRLVARDPLYAFAAAALEREHADPDRWLLGDAAQEGEAQFDADDAFLWPLTDRVASLFDVLAAAVSVWFAEDVVADAALTLVPLRSCACLGALLRSTRRRLTLLATGGTTSAEPSAVAMARGASFCAHLCALVAGLAADGGEWQNAMARSPDICNSMIELLRVVDHVERRVEGASFGHIKRELLRAIANLLAGRDAMLA